MHREYACVCIKVHRQLETIILAIHMLLMYPNKSSLIVIFISLKNVAEFHNACGAGKGSSFTVFLF
jgi:hypothetical protein